MLLESCFLVNSTFFLLLLKDVCMPDVLVKVARCVRLLTTVQVLDEVYAKLLESGLAELMGCVEEAVCYVYDANSSDVREENPLVIHEPLMHRGEFSLVLVFWYLWYRCELRDLYLVTDDEAARRYILNNVEDIPRDRVLWSLRFLDDFAVSRRVVDVDVFLELLRRVERSGFHVSKEILEFYYKKYCGR